MGVWDACATASASGSSRASRDTSTLARDPSPLPCCVMTDAQPGCATRGRCVLCGDLVETRGYARCEGLVPNAHPTQKCRSYAAPATKPEPVGRCFEWSLSRP